MSLFIFEFKGVFKDLKYAYSGFADDIFFVNKLPGQNPVYKFPLHDVVMNFSDGDFIRMLKDFVKSGQVSLGIKHLINIRKLFRKLIMNFSL
jgi:hypothetical protein